MRQVLAEITAVSKAPDNEDSKRLYKLHAFIKARMDGTMPEDEANKIDEIAELVDGKTSEREPVDTSYDEFADDAVDLKGGVADDFGCNCVIC
jgi:hypothetical protein